MAQEFLSLLHLETKRLLWLIGITFAVIIAFQYFELLPYGNAVLSLFSAYKMPTTISETTISPSSSPKLEIVSNDATTVGSLPNKSIAFDESDKGVHNNITSTGFSSVSTTNGSSGAKNIVTTLRPEKAPPPPYLTPPPSSSPATNDDNNNMQGKNSSINIIQPHQVTLVSEMTKLLLQTHASNRSMRPRWFSAVDQELVQARLEIENAPIIENDPNIYAPIFHNVSMFKRSYELMEEKLKVYVYREGDKPILHSPSLTGIYASEGWFMRLMEAVNQTFATEDPNKAHLFYLPISSRKLMQTFYVQGEESHSFDIMVQYLHDYVDLIARRHPFWNRTGGADHFLVGCHDWVPAETKEHLSNCIRALCNADVKHFVFGKDVSLPETLVHTASHPVRDLGGYPPSERKTLAFFAGRMHGYVRPVLLQHWENKDPDMKIFGKLPKVQGNRIYIEYMKSSKYCICARGYEVNSPRVVEAISFECVPVIISDNFVPPFFEVLNWESFSVIVLEKDIPNLKNILLSIPEKRYLTLFKRVKKVQQHFLWHKRNVPVKYDVFHMILHSIWYNRVFSVTGR